MTLREGGLVVTPEAYGVDPTVIGRTLASVPRRLSALLIDGAVIALLTLVTRGSILVLGLAGAFFLVRVGVRGAPHRGSRLSRALARGAGALGMVVAIGTCGLWVTGREDEGEQAVTEVMEEAEVASSEAAPTPTPAEPIGMGESERSPDPALARRIAELEAALAEAEADAANARDRTEAAVHAGAVDRIRSTADALGFGFGWATIYMAVLLSWWNGQTVGKRLMGVRVVRLDGGPITWWVGFERAGGYAAGLATGLLGFAQALWHPNRQAIHDRIAGTVVVREEGVAHEREAQGGDPREGDPREGDAREGDAREGEGP